jgi:hypothetical protein
VFLLIGERIKFSFFAACMLQQEKIIKIIINRLYIIIIENIIQEYTINGNKHLYGPNWHQHR